MNLLSQTIDTNTYMIAGFAVILGVILIYIASLAIRHNKIIKEIEMIEQINSNEKAN
jgi:hypothetical protein